MSTILEALERGWKYHEAGEFDQAEQLYRQVLEADARNVTAWQLLGTIGYQIGRFESAVECLRNAVALAPTRADLYNNLGAAYRSLQRADEAVKCFQESLRLDATSAGAFNNLGLALTDQGNAAAALSFYQQALRLEPNYVEGHYNLGLALAQLKEFAAAAACFERALALRPDYLKALLNLGNMLQDQGKLAEAADRYRQLIVQQPASAEAHYNLGIVLKQQGEIQQAVNSFRDALRLQPTWPEAHCNLSATLVRQQRFDDAVLSAREAVRLRPDYVEALENLGGALKELNRYDEAAEALRRCVQLRPESAEIHNALAGVLLMQGQLNEALFEVQQALLLDFNLPAAHANLGTALFLMGRLAEAEATYNQTLEQHTDNAEVHWNRSLLWLMQGDFTRGWSEYEWRWRRRDAEPRNFYAALWDGSPLAGRTILLHAEQGMGDTLQFIRYAPLVKRRGGTVVVECQPPLLKFLAGCPGVDRVVAYGDELPPFEVHAPLMTLPAIFGTRLETIPCEIPYLLVDTELRQKWRDELAAEQGFKVGIVWQGRQERNWVAYRSVPLSSFAPLANVPGVKLFSLQKGPGVEQLAGQKFPVKDFSQRLDEATGPFLDTAALMRNLDLVISVDTATVHLAGALGVPVWVAIPVVPDWRWMLDRTDTPWYPTMKLFRQTRLGDWQSVFEQMAEELQELSSRPKTRPAKSGDASP